VGLVFAQADVRKVRRQKNGGSYVLPVGGSARTRPEKLVAYDAVVVERDVSELRAAINVIQGPMQVRPFICTDCSTRATCQPLVAKKPARVLPALPNPMTRA
jgi:hypothetical protein